MVIKADTKYKVHQFEIRMTKDKDKLESFLNSLEGDVVAILPNVQPKFLPMGASAVVDFVFVVEKIKS